MKKRKGKAVKKAMKFAERKAKAEKWVSEYDGAPYGVTWEEMGMRPDMDGIDD
ncbi:hypothetical protein IMSAGC002_00029 [Lachnospiraceae bacterium]|nr:hypothetical protein IMSAGC002_00029 [Lachnospiraceae bacterium]